MVSPKERILLKRLAEAYAFISDLRGTAIARLDQYYINRTDGIDLRIVQLKTSYPKVFARYLNKASSKKKVKQEDE